MKLMLVHWMDANSAAGWTDLHNFEPDHGLTFSVGWLVHEDEQCLVLAGTWDETTETFNNYIQIPKGMIKMEREIWS